ncbi:NADPH-adrenodoxin reductase [Serendipita sp. 399]|nr:NADPH-adrenodoxin reductase [Serendipita sp. 399]
MIPIDSRLLEPPPDASRQQSRILDLLRKGSAAKPSSTKKTWSLEFFRSPTKVIEGGVEFGINELDEEQRAVPTGKTETHKTDLVVNSVGYRSEPVEAEWYDGALGRVRQHGGRVMDGEGKVLEGVYASGWAANGAKGVLATTMMDAYAVVERLLEDNVGQALPTYEAGLPPELSSSDRRVVSYDDWKRIDEEEIRRGQEVGKERERMKWSQVLEFLG